VLTGSGGKGLSQPNQRAPPAQDNQYSGIQGSRLPALQDAVYGHLLINTIFYDAGTQLLWANPLGFKLYWIKRIFGAVINGGRKMMERNMGKIDKNVEKARANMIEQQIRPAEVLDPRVLETISETPREAFVPENYQELAFSDINVDLGNEQLMMKPIMEARILQALNIQPGDKILEIGTGSGYLTALLAKLGGHVESVEIDPKVLKKAETRLKSQKITNATLVQGDASQGWNQNESYDVIAITGSFPLLPESFQKQLTVGGRMAVIVGQSPVMEALLITRAAEDQWVTKALFETDFPALLNAERPQAFIF